MSKRMLKTLTNDNSNVFFTVKNIKKKTNNELEGERLHENMISSHMKCRREKIAVAMVTL